MVGMLRTMAISLLGRAAGMGLFLGGFWLLFKGFLNSSVPLGLLGGVMIPLGMGVLVIARKGHRI